MPAQKVKIVPGLEYNHWTTIRRAPKRPGDTRLFVVCRCVCGKRGAPAYAALLSGKSRSCGCRRYTDRAPGGGRKRIELAVGHESGRWTVTGPSVVTKGNTRYPCRCECGTERLVLARRLRDGSSQSCGCAPLTEAELRQREANMRAAVARRVERAGTQEATKLRARQHRLPRAAQGPERQQLAPARDRQTTPRQPAAAPPPQPNRLSLIRDRVRAVAQIEAMAEQYQDL